MMLTQHFLNVFHNKYAGMKAVVDFTLKHVEDIVTTLARVVNKHLTHHFVKVYLTFQHFLSRKHF